MPAADHHHPVTPTPVASGRRPRGFTLVELLVAMALAAVLLAVSVPSFSMLLAKMRVEGAANNLSTDLQLARSEALQRRANVSLATSSDGTSYTLTSGTTTLKTVSLGSGLSFTGSVTITFEPLRGLANAGTINTISSLSSGQLRIATDVMGRVQFCSPDGLFKGYPSC